MKNDLRNSLSRSFNKIGFTFKKHSPEILAVAGVVGVVTSGVMACKATLKVNEVVNESKKNTERIHEACVNGITDAGETYTTEDAKKDLTLNNVQTCIKVAKLYAPSVILGALSITSLLASNRILRKRNLGLAAAYATVDRGFKEYRGRVIERFGKELDKELKYNVKAQEIEETIVDENGKEKKVKSVVNMAAVSERSSYSRIFDETCTNWERNAEYNNMFLRETQKFLNQRLKEKGHMFLNEVYEALGFDKSQQGQIVGWIYDPSDPTCSNYIDFGIDDIHDENKRMFVNGHEYSIILDFNPDGDIFSLMK